MPLGHKSSLWKGFNGKLNFCMKYKTGYSLFVFWMHLNNWMIQKCFLFQRVDNLLTYFCSFLLMSIGSVAMSHPLFLQYSLDVCGIYGKVLPFIFVILLLIMLLFLINLRLSVVFVISKEQYVLSS